MLTQNRLDRLNDIFGQELGRNPYGEPKFRWGWSEDLIHWKRKEESFNMVQIPGSPLIVAEPEYEQRRICPSLLRQYVLTKWEPPMPEAEWNQYFGDKLMWPRRGYYMPVSAITPSGWADVAPEQTLTVDFTYSTIETIRKQRELTFADLVAQGENAMEKKEKERRSEIDDRLSDSFTAYGNVPGMRGGHVALQVGRNFMEGTEVWFGKNRGLV